MSKYAATTAHAFLQLENDLLGTYNLWDCYATAKLALALELELTRTHNHEFYHADLIGLSAVTADGTEIAVSGSVGNVMEALQRVFGTYTETPVF